MVGHMKRFALTAIAMAISSLAGGSLFAGSPTFKSSPAPPECEYGVGWYAALEGGANVYQSFEGSHTRHFGNGDEVSLEVDHNVGGYGGVKLGYVFGKGNIRFGLEEEMFYNGIPTDARVSFNGTR